MKKKNKNILEPLIHISNIFLNMSCVKGVTAGANSKSHQKTAFDK